MQIHYNNWKDISNFIRQHLQSLGYSKTQNYDENFKLDIKNQIKDRFEELLSDNKKKDLESLENEYEYNKQKITEYYDNCGKQRNMLDTQIDYWLENLVSKEEYIKQQACVKDSATELFNTN